MLRRRALRSFVVGAAAFAAFACSNGTPPPVTPEANKPPKAAADATAPSPSEAPSAAPSASASAEAEAPLQAPPGKLNVLLVTIDSLRADMPWQGYERDIAPALTAFEKQ